MKAQSGIKAAIFTREGIEACRETKDSARGPEWFSEISKGQ
jgi:hypothetical protein